MLVLALVASLGTAGLFFATGGFAKGTRPMELVAFTAGLGLVAAVVVTHLSVGAARSMLGRPRQELVAMTLALAPALALVAVVASAVWPLDGFSSEPELSAKTHLACGLLTLVQGAVPLAALLFARSGTDPVHPAVTGAALGTTAGAWTAMMAYLRCPHAGPLHALLAHVAPTLLFTIGGILLARTLTLASRASRTDQG
jgi:hypothetical protein